MVKITALTALTQPDDADILAIVDDPAGTPVTKKITVANLRSSAGDVTLNADSDGSGAGEILFHINSVEVGVFDNAGNFGVGQSTFGTSAAKVLAIGSGTAPTTSPADAAQLWVADDPIGGATNAAWWMRTESGGHLVFGSDLTNRQWFHFKPTLADSTAKIARTVVDHYLNAEEPVLLLDASAGSTNNLVKFGGGSSQVNAATHIEFYTAPDNTTPTGTEVLRIDDAQRVDYRTGSVALGGGASATLGTIGGSGPTTAGQNGWLEIKVGGVSSWVPYWR